MIDKNNGLIRQLVGRAVIIFEEKVLLVRGIDSSFFFLPGGRVDPGEGVADCIVREIKEELNQNSSIKKYLGAVEHEFVNDSGNFYEVNHYFLVDLETPLEAESAEDKLVFEWIKLSDIHLVDVEPKPVIDLIKKASVLDSFWGSTL